MDVCVWYLCVHMLVYAKVIQREMLSIIMLPLGGVRNGYWEEMITFYYKPFHLKKKKNCKMTFKAQFYWQWRVLSLEDTIKLSQFSHGLVD